MNRFHDSLQRLSADEAAQLAARVAELTKAGLPLGDGLRALADELPGWRLPRVLRNVANRLDAGDSLVAALESQGSRLPGHLRGLMLAGVRSGRLAEVLEEYVDLQRSQLELRRRIWTTLAYPFVLLVLMTMLTAFAGLIIVPGFVRIFQDFGTKLPDLTVWVIKGSRPMVLFFTTLLVLSILVPMWLRMSPGLGWLWPALYRVPMIGPLLRWIHLSRFARLMGVLLDQQVPLPEALRVTAVGLRDTRLAQGCRLAAEDVERGRPLGESLAARRPFPPTLIPMVQWGQQAAALPEAFHAASEMFEGRARSHGTLLETTMLPIMLMLILMFVGFFVVAMFLPMLRLVVCLAG